MPEEYRIVTNERKPNAFMPVMGLTIGVCFAVMAYFAAPFIIDILQDNFAEFEAKTANVEEMTLRLTIAGAMWFVLFSLAMFLVAMVAGDDSLVQEEQKTIQPKGKKMTRRSLERHQRKLDRQRRKRLEALKRMRDKQQRESSRESRK